MRMCPKCKKHYLNIGFIHPEENVRYVECANCGHIEKAKKNYDKQIRVYKKDLIGT